MPVGGVQSAAQVSTAVSADCGLKGPSRISTALMRSLLCREFHHRGEKPAETARASSQGRGQVKGKLR